ELDGLYISMQAAMDAGIIQDISLGRLRNRNQEIDIRDQEIDITLKPLDEIARLEELRAFDRDQILTDGRDANPMVLPKQAQHREIVRPPSPSGQQEDIAGTAVRKRRGAAAESVHPPIHAGGRGSAPPPEHLLCAAADPGLAAAMGADLVVHWSRHLRWWTVIRQFGNRNEPPAGRVIATQPQPLGHDIPKCRRIALLDPHCAVRWPAVLSPAGRNIHPYRCRPQAIERFSSHRWAHHSTAPRLINGRASRPVEGYVGCHELAWAPIGRLAAVSRSAAR